MRSNIDTLRDIRDNAKGILLLTQAILKKRAITDAAIIALHDDGQSIANLADELRNGVRNI